jgi:hypothetical protein
MYQGPDQTHPLPPQSSCISTKPVGFKDPLEGRTGLIDTYMDTYSGMMDTYMDTYMDT